MLLTVVTLVTRRFGLTLCVVVWVSVSAHSLGAQTSFVWPSTASDVATYGVVETCLAHVKNVLGRVRNPPSATLEDAGHRPFSRGVVNGARQCAAGFMVEQLVIGERAHINAVENAYQLFLAAEWDAQAKTLARQWLASLPPSEDSLRLEGVRRLMRAAVASFVPPRWDEAWALIDLLDRQTFWQRRFALVGELMDKAYYRSVDTTQVLRAARWLLEEERILNAHVTDTASWRTGGSKTMYQARQHVHGDALVDSLRRSTRSYFRYLNTLRQTSQLKGEELARQAPPLHGEYWFPAQPSAGRPAPGAVSLVLSIVDNECGECHLTVAAIKQLHRRFPEVEFTLVTKTRGYHGLVIEPPVPDVEARLIDSVYRKVHQLPATLVVHRTQFTRVDEIDRRRINTAGPNDRTYPRFVTPIVSFDGAYIIDRNGVLVAGLEWAPFNYRKIERMLDAVVHQ